MGFEQDLESQFGLSGVTYAADLARDDEGELRVLADFAQAPSGAGYAAENRLVMSRVFPSLYRNAQVHRISSYFRHLRAGLRSLGKETSDDPTVVILTPGNWSETAFEHGYLASQLGFTLVEGSELVVRDGKVMLRALGRLQQVDVVLRRLDATYCDPLELDPTSRLGVPGLVEATRRGTVAVVNPLGAAVIENPALQAFMPEVARTLLGQELELRGTDTWWCGNPEVLARVRAEFDSLVIIPIDRNKVRSIGPRSVSRLTADQRTSLMAEIEAASMPNRREAVESFDEALRGHIGYAVRNGARSLLFGLTRGRFAEAPGGVGEAAKYYRKLSRMSAAYAFLADFAMLFLGGGLKRKEMLSGRFADGLMHMYMASAVLKRFEDTGRPEADRPLMEWSVRHALFETQVALDQILRNFPSTAVGLLLRGIVFPLGRRYRTPNDRLMQACARVLMTDSEARDRLTSGVFVSDDPEDVTGSIEHAFAAVAAADPAERKLRESRRKQPWGVEYGTWLQTLVAEGVIDAGEDTLLEASADATRRVIMVDDFPNDFLQGGASEAATPSRSPVPVTRNVADGRGQPPEPAGY